MKINYKIAALAVVVLVVGIFTLAQPRRIWGDCMEPAIKDGQLIFLNRIAPYIRSYRIGDVILFKHDEKVWISRVVALENNLIQITERQVVVDGHPLQDAGINRNWSNWQHGSYGIEKPIQVPLGHVFVLSDNLSAQHDDSRVFGPISEQSILGLVWSLSPLF